MKSFPTGRPGSPTLKTTRKLSSHPGNRTRVGTVIHCSSPVATAESPESDLNSSPKAVTSHLHHSGQLRNCLGKAPSPVQYGRQLLTCRELHLAQAGMWCEHLGHSLLFPYVAIIQGPIFFFPFKTYLFERQKYKERRTERDRDGLSVD